MTATKRLAELPEYDPGWKLTQNGRDWSAGNPRYGEVHTAVVVDKSGKPLFDRPAYCEAPNVNIVAWGRAKDGIRVAVIRQPRPHADDPEQPGNDHPPVVFGQIPMGFMEKLIGENGADAARREVGEETGATAVIRVTRPEYPYHNPNPTFVRTWSDLYFVEVDLDKIEELKADHSEPIYSAEYISVPELLMRICLGKDTEGAVYRMCTSNSLWLIFFATYPEFWQV